MSILQDISSLLQEGRAKQVVALVRQALEEGLDPKAIMNDGLLAGMAVIGFTGKGGGRMADMCDYLVNVPSSHTPHIQEIHEAVMHLLCQLTDHYLFQNPAALSEAR
jgi:hypothetical protein